MESRSKCRVCMGFFEAPLMQEDVCPRCRNVTEGRTTVTTPVAAGPRMVLRCYGDEGRFADHALADRDTWKIGKASDCDLAVQDVQISREHVVISRQGDAYVLEDQGSGTGTYLNGQRVQTSALRSGDIIRIGSTWLEVREEIASLERPAAKAELPKHLEKHFQIGREKILIGRSQDNDVVLDSPNVSRKHAAVDKGSGRFYLQDLKSTNGTFLNSERIVERVRLKPGDVISLGSFSLIFDGSGLREESANQQLEIQARELVKMYGRDRILDRVSLSVQSQELIGVLGPSGSGKTHLLKILAGIASPSSGQVVYNGISLFRNLSLFRKRIGYVPQDDIVYKELTAFQNFYYAAKLRLPLDTGEDEIVDSVEEVLKTLQLQNRCRLRVSKLSGGQRKRVNIGVELFMDPAVLFLDEPLSGLDPETASHLVRLFRRLAQQGRTVLVTTHTMENFDAYDKVAILYQGVMVFFGPPREALDFFQAEFPAAIYTNLAKLSPKKWLELYHRTPAYVRCVAEPALRAGAKPPARGSGIIRRLWRYAMQRISLKPFRTLTERYLDIKLSDRKSQILLILQAVILGGVLATISSGERIALILMMIVVYFGVINGLREIVRENTILARERLVFLKIPSYLASKFAVLALYTLFQTLILLLIARTFIGLPGDFNGYLLSLGVCSLSSLAFGLFCSVISGNSERANLMIPIALLPQVFYSGTIVPINEMNAINHAVSTLAISRWTITGFMENYVGHSLVQVWQETQCNVCLGALWMALTALFLYTRKKEKLD